MTVSSVASLRFDALRVGSNDRAVATFVSVQLFILVYFQKLALLSTSFPLSVPMLAMFAGLAFMMLSGHLVASPLRAAFYLIFIGCALFSQAVVGPLSVPSLIQMILLYTFMIFDVQIGRELYEQILRRFVAFMVLPAIIVLIQYGYQRLTGLTDPISMTGLLPKSILMQGFYYEDHFPWNSTFMRPNGFFCLEPSFVSAFTASAAIIEVTYFRRPAYLALMIGASVFSLGATGTAMLVIAAPLVLCRQRPPIIVMVSLVAVIGVVTAVLAGLPIPGMSRIDEIGDASSSGGGRVLLPAMRLITLLSDPTYFFAGNGAGSVSREMLAWPFLKLMDEYGHLTTIAFAVLYFVGIASSENRSLKVALSVVFLFSGGYLLDPAMLELVVLLLFIVRPRKTEAAQMELRDHMVQADIADRYSVPIRGAACLT